MRRIRPSVTDTNVRYGPRNMPRGIASNGEASYSVTNLDSALTMLMAVYVYGEEAVKDTRQIALENTTGQNSFSNLALGVGLGISVLTGFRTSFGRSRSRTE
ncbi:hypothetical protein ElyMa_000126700 [Elysia marginata]|uniref:Uncharacterized protein n=1 Tax=Elysia marginata TaxID=1093978 RepID=A0AAV4EP52_9GAST|nr:hypothetical protein ElyMa_000126700 [Elysia marginata]